MHTVVIWNELTDSLRYAIINEDWSRFDGVYVNTAHDPRASELCDLVYGEVGDELIDFLDEFPVQFMKENDCIVIEAGFLP